jgi:adenosyl cobinamide kinase/adenosyl cobinamide phosphate guanylyltransferase
MFEGTSQEQVEAIQSRGEKDRLSNYDREAMGENYIILCADGSVADYTASLATRSGDDLGLVLTAIEFEQEKVSGGRVEEDRSYGGTTFQTFDEPIFIGSAIAQLAGHADAVVLESIEDWSDRLLRRFPDDPVELDAEISSLISVMRSQMCDLFLLCRKPELVDKSDAVRELTARILGQIKQYAAGIVDVSGESPAVLEGSLPEGA